MRTNPALASRALPAVCLALMLSGCGLVGLDKHAVVTITDHYTKVMMGTFEVITYAVENTGNASLASVWVRIKVKCADGMTYADDVNVANIGGGETVADEVWIETPGSPTTEVTACVFQAYTI